ncbi:MAG: hypothetical protein FWG43_06390, partial [Clostridiales bacterium]|nr:hypothetical protein [Clostridiales bacterium]
MKKNLLILLLTVTLVISLSAAALADDSVDAKPTSSTVLVNGKKVAFDAYNINGNNYFKLRDLAYTLSGTAKQFEIDFNSESNGITITGAKPYTAVGGEMKGKGAGDKSAIPTNSKIYFGDKEVRISAYNIENNNYFKLRDVGAVLDFGVDWDAAKNTIVIDTSKVYSPVMPINANVPNWNEIIGSVNGVDIFRYEYDYYLNYFFSSYYESMTQYQSIDQLDEEYLSEFFSSIEEQAWESTIYAALVRQMAA